MSLCHNCCYSLFTIITKGCNFNRHFCSLQKSFWWVNIFFFILFSTQTIQICAELATSSNYKLYLVPSFNFFRRRGRAKIRRQEVRRSVSNTFNSNGIFAEPKTVKISMPAFSNRHRRREWIRVHSHTLLAWLASTFTHTFVLLSFTSSSSSFSPSLPLSLPLPPSL